MSLVANVSTDEPCGAIEQLDLEVNDCTDAEPKFNDESGWMQMSSQNLFNWSLFYYYAKFYLFIYLFIWELSHSPLSFVSSK